MVIEGNIYKINKNKIGDKMILLERGINSFLIEEVKKGRRSILCTSKNIVEGNNLFYEMSKFYGYDKVIK